MRWEWAVWGASLTCGLMAALMLGLNVDWRIGLAVGAAVLLLWTLAARVGGAAKAPARVERASGECVRVTAYCLCGASMRSVSPTRGVPKG